MTIEKKLVALLNSQKKTVSFAESCTGGGLTQRLTSVSGASKVFGFGIVSYSAKAKNKCLGIPLSLIRKYGEVSREVALAMAQGIQKISKSDYAVSITGIAGPTGGSLSKPVGTVYLSLISKEAEHIKKHYLQGSRNQIRKKATSIALQWLFEVLTKGGGDGSSKYSAR